MKQMLTETTVLFLSVLKWAVLATLVGTIVGVSSTLFLKALTWSIGFTSQHPYYFLLLPIAFFLSIIIVKYLAPDAEGHGTEKVIEAIHQRAGVIKAIVVPVKLVATIITIACGGSAGKEGPCAQIGAGLASIFGKLLKLDASDHKKLVICGISAGFASVFGTPLAGAMFGVEVLFIGNILYGVLLPSFIAGITSYHISSSLGITYFYRPLNFIPVFSEAFFIKVMLAGVFFGLCSTMMIETMEYCGKLVQRIKGWIPLKGLIGGAILIGLALIFSKEYLGLGLNTIESALQGESIPWYAFLVKILFTVITLSFGGSGGVVTPIFFIGTTSGSFLGQLLNQNTATFAAIGMVAVLAGTANTPIAASIMAVELFGPKVAPYACVACVISFLVTGHRSIYPSQVLSIKKSASLRVQVGEVIEDIEPEYQSRKQTLTGKILQLFRLVKEMTKEEEPCESDTETKPSKPTDSTNYKS